MPVPFLAINTIDGTTPQLRRYVGATSSNIGVPFGALDASPSGGNHQWAAFRAIQFGGHQTFYAAVGGFIYRTTDGGASWSSVCTLTSINASQNIKSGIHIIPINGVPHLCLFYATTTANTWRGVKSSDGTTWTNEGPFTLATTFFTNGCIIDEVTYRNSIYLTIASSSVSNKAIAFYSPGASSAGFFAVTGGAADRSALVVWNDVLYMLRDAGAARFLTDVSAGIGSDVLTLLASGGTGAAAGARYTAFVDGANLYCVFYTAAAEAWRVTRITPSLVANSIPASVPFQMTGTTLGGTSPTTSRVKAFVDTEAMPGSNPTKYIFYAANGASGTGWSLFKWNGESVPMSLEDGGGNAQHALSCGIRAGGSYFWTPGDRHCEIVTRTAIIGGLRYSFKLFSPNASPDPVNVRAWFGTGDDEYPMTAATLFNPSAGSMSGNTITGLDGADNGATTFQVTWNATADGFPNGTRGKFLFEVY